MTHKLGHEGKLFSAGIIKLNLTDDGYSSLLLHNDGHCEVAMLCNAGAEGKALLDIFLNPTVTDIGNSVTVYNLNKSPYSKLSVVKVYAGTVVSNPGTQALPQDMIYGGVGPRTSGAGHESNRELIVPPGAKVLIRIQNISGQSKDVVVGATWAEYTNFCTTTTTTTTTTTV